MNESKFQILSEVFGIPDSNRLHQLLDSGKNPAERIQACLQLYRSQLRKAFQAAKGTGYADAYTLRSLEGEYKYHLMFATAHPKGIVLASNIVYRVEEGYQQELQEHREREKRDSNTAVQLSWLEAEPEPTLEEIFQEKVRLLKTDIWRMFRGQKQSRLQIHAAILDTWFGVIKATHLTDALKMLLNEGCILSMRGGTISQDQTIFTFKAS